MLWMLVKLCILLCDVSYENQLISIMMNGALRRLNDVTHLEIMKESVLENRIGLIDWVNSV